MYNFYLDKLLLPVTPSALSIKINGRNETVNLINEGEINIIKKTGLKEISFTCLLPNVKYPFARYIGDFRRADYFMAEIERLKNLTDSNKEFIPFNFTVTRELEGGKLLFSDLPLTKGGQSPSSLVSSASRAGLNVPTQVRAAASGVSNARLPSVLTKGIQLFSTNLQVVIENVTFAEDAGADGFDVSCEIELKEYKAYGTQSVTITETPQGAQIKTEPARLELNAPSNLTHTVIKGESLSSIAALELNDWSAYDKIYQKNKEMMDARNAPTGELKYTIYPNQVLQIPR